MAGSWASWSLSLPLIYPDSVPTAKHCQEEFQVVPLPTVLAMACPDLESPWELTWEHLRPLGFGILALLTQV